MRNSEIRKLVKARKRLGLSRSTIARRLAVAENTLRRWETGQCKPLPVYQSKVARLARALSRYRKS